MLIAEELLLLALNDDKGKVMLSASSALDYALAGAILVELSIEGCITLENNKIKINESAQINDPVLKRTLSIIQEETKPRTVKRWVQNKLKYSVKDIKRRLLERLVEAGILEQKEHTFLWLFPYSSFPEKDQEPELHIRERLRTTILSEEENLDPRTVVLASLIKACNLVNEVFEKDERRLARNRIKALAEKDVYGKAVQETVTAMQAAIIAATTAATASAAASSSSS